MSPSHSEHEEKSGIIFCDQCQKQFPTPSKLERHQLTHNKNSDYECTTCSKRFGRVDNLKRHELLHETREFYCTDCLKQFNTERSFEYHRRTRTDTNYVHGEGAKLCEKCSSAVGASTHQIIPNKYGGRIHQCTYCFDWLARCSGTTKSGGIYRLYILKFRHFHEIRRFHQNRLLSGDQVNYLEMA